MSEQITWVSALAISRELGVGRGLAYKVIGASGIRSHKMEGMKRVRYALEDARAVREKAEREGEELAARQRAEYEKSQSRVD